MSFTLANVQTSVQTLGYGADTAAQQTEFLRSALRRLYGQRRWRFLRKTDSTLTIATSASTCSLTSITDRQKGKLESVRLVSPVGTLELDELEAEELRAMDAADNSNGCPLYYARTDDDTLQFWPRADKSYTVQIDYISLPTLPASGGDTVVWPDEYQDVLVWAVVRGMAYRQRDWFSTPTADAEYSTRLNEMNQAESRRGPQTPPRVVHWSGWDRLAR